ncbi:MAG: L-histidine N(alpha)-methyltransferase [Candidatus Rariloculaceae bacterium]
MGSETAVATATQATRDDLVDDVIAGLSAKQKSISPRYFYDQAGSELFDRIRDLPEYYLTRTEQRIMEENLPEIAELIGARASVIEFGSGSSAKIRALLDHLQDPAAYVPVDVSGDYLLEMADELASDYPGLTVRPVAADFTRPFDLPKFDSTPEKNVVFCPGSTIGNLEGDEALKLLGVMRAAAKPGGALLIGVDLVKDTEIILAAYNDSQGLTAEFNLNVLGHLNGLLGANFELEHFRHEAVYDASECRIEMRLVSTRRQTVTLAGTQIEFDADEFIITEYSHKYSREAFSTMAVDAGFSPSRIWTDPDELFSVHHLTVPGATSSG